MDGSFDDLRRMKWIQGREEHRLPGQEDEFQGDPLHEFACEMLDAANYLDVMLERGIISQRARDVWYGIVRLAFGWVNSLPSR